MSTQHWDATKYQQTASFVSAYGRDVVTLLAPQRGERILDLGCGDGTLALEIAEEGATVVGVDAAEDMVRKARAKGIDAHQASGDALSFQEEFDAVFSNATLHWIKDYEAVIQCVQKALKPGGRFVAEFGGANNIKRVADAMQQVFASTPDKYGTYNDPWFFPSVELYKAALEKHGFTVPYCELIRRDTPVKNGVRAWLDLFANGITKHMSEETREQFLNETVELLKPELYSPAEGWWVDYVRLRFAAHL